MIFCGKLSSAQVVKILGIIQCVLSIIITCLGITITVKFREVHHETGSEYELAIDYVNNPWTTKYGAGIWMGLVLLVAGIFGSTADVKPEKSKYTYASLVFNILAVIVALIFIPYTANAISWYESCTYTYHIGNGKIGTRDCSTQDKSMGNDLYVTLLVALILILPVTIITIVFIVYANLVLFDGCCDGGCYRQLIYKVKGGSAAKVKVKTKNTHEFDQVYIENVSSDPGENHFKNYPPNKSPVVENNHTENNYNTDFNTDCYSSNIYV